MNWHDVGYMAVDNYVFDVGGQTSRAIERLRDGIAPLEAGGREEFSQGNGSLMRVLPLALWHRGSDAKLVELAHAQSAVTHGHPTAQACCALYCLWAHYILLDVRDPWSVACGSLQNVYGAHPIHNEALVRDILPAASRDSSGTGFVVDCLFSAKAVLGAGPYEDVVKAAVALGNDTDTTACVAGGLAGLRDGIDAIPARWRDNLRGGAIIKPLLDSLRKIS
jgi:ADP-ribosylglycohydrolase